MNGMTPEERDARLKQIYSMHNRENNVPDWLGYTIAAVIVGSAFLFVILGYFRR